MIPTNLYCMKGYCMNAGHPILKKRYSRKKRCSDMGDKERD